MKCPFQTTEKRFYGSDPFSPNSYGKEIKKVTEFADCLGDECPFFDQKLVCSITTAPHVVTFCRRVSQADDTVML